MLKIRIKTEIYQKAIDCFRLFPIIYQRNFDLEECVIKFAKEHSRCHKNFLTAWDPYSFSFDTLRNLLVQFYDRN